MTEREWLLACLAEEAAELGVELAELSKRCSALGKAAMKALRFGIEDRNPLVPDKTNWERMEAELSDLNMIAVLLGLNPKPVVTPEKSERFNWARNYAITKGIFDTEHS